MNRPILHEPTPKSFRPDADHEHGRRVGESVFVILALVAVFCWWLGHHVYQAWTRGNAGIVAVAEQIGVRGR